MDRNSHYDKTKEAFKFSAIERDGYYDATPGKSLRHRLVQLRVRKIALNILADVVRSAPHITTAIDVGCGRGDFTMELTKRFPQLVEVSGCDFSKETLSIAKGNAASLDRVSFYEAELLDIPFADQFFDVTLCINVLHHIHPSDQAKALSELARITRKYLLLEVKNQENVYWRIQQRSWNDIDIFPISVRKVIR